MIQINTIPSKSCSFGYFWPFLSLEIQLYRLIRFLRFDVEDFSRKYSDPCIQLRKNSVLLQMLKNFPFSLEREECFFLNVSNNLFFFIWNVYSMDFSPQRVTE